MLSCNVKKHSGRAFFVHDRDGFMEQHFGGAKFTSFTRRLKRWKFVRVAQGKKVFFDRQINQRVKFVLGANTTIKICIWC